MSRTSGPPSSNAKILTVNRREAGLRLDLFLTGAIEGLSRKRAKRLVDGRRVSVNGRIEAMASRHLKGGETVRVELEAPTPPSEAPSIRVLWEDDVLLAVDKPPGLPSGPTRDPNRSQVEGILQVQRSADLTLVHRLDRDTTGVLLLAKTKAAARALVDAFRARRVGKTYLALVRGRPAPRFQVTSHLREGQGRVHTVRSGGMRAETVFETATSSRGYAVVRAHPRTGRMHQIRVHLAGRGLPIVGDALYGGPATVANRSVHRQMLHASALTVPHPVSGSFVTLEAPLPADFRRVATAALGRPLAARLLG